MFDIELVRRGAGVFLGLVFVVVGDTIGKRHQQGFHLAAVFSCFLAAV